MTMTDSIRWTSVPPYSIIATAPPSCLVSKKKLHLGDSISFYFRERIVNVYDLARGFIILQNEDLNLLNELNASELLTPDQKKRLDILRTEINHNIDRMNHVTLQLEQNYPKAYRHALTVKSIRMMLTYERRTIRKPKTMA